MNKKARAYEFVLLIIVIGFIGSIAYSYHTCSISEQETTLYKKYMEDKSSVDWSKEGFSLGEIEFKRILGCKQEHKGILDKTGYWLKEKLGFNQTFFDFIFKDFWVGLLAGLLIWAVYNFAVIVTRYTMKPGVVRRGADPRVFRAFYLGRAGDRSKLRRSWLYLIGSGIWKSLVIAIAYATLMQFPIISGIINFMLLEFLRDNLLIRVFLLAFYIGLLPAAIEEFSRYKIRRHYDAEIEEAKQQKRFFREVTRS